MISHVMQRHVYQTKICSVYELKRLAIDAWYGLEQTTNDMAIDPDVEHFKRASVLNEDTPTCSTACELN